MGNGKSQRLSIPNPKAVISTGVGDATIAKIQGNYYIYCDRESQGSPYKVTAWRSKSLMEPFEFLGLAITPRSNEVDDWDNYRIQGCRYCLHSGTEALCDDL
jgi:beta-xylosidase